MQNFITSRFFQTAGAVTAGAIISFVLTAAPVGAVSCADEYEVRRAISYCMDGATVDSGTISTYC
ncbi:hypothetical protein OAI24_03110 [Alphaproteobacteria bacterium]|jgi:hypothetical protein|nr:hypothetical protein [Alphaproteobacteria bacterium]